MNLYQAMSQHCMSQPVDLKCVRGWWESLASNTTVVPRRTLIHVDIPHHQAAALLQYFGDQTGKLTSQEMGAFSSVVVKYAQELADMLDPETVDEKLVTAIKKSPALPALAEPVRDDEDDDPDLDPNF